MPVKKRRKPRRKKSSPAARCGTCEACRSQLGFCPRSVRSTYKPEEMP